MAISSAVMASQATLFRPTPNFTPKFPHTPTNPIILHLKPKLYSLPKLTCLALRPISSSSEPEPEPEPTLSLSSSAPTRTLTTLFALALPILRTISLPLLRLAPFALSSAKPLFFAAAASSSSSGPLNTPLTVVAAGLSKWLDIYSAVLLVRVLLSWFPNIPWDQQPLSAIRDLCDPYLNLFRNIIPPVFNTLDISPLMAFAVLGTLGSILNNSAKGV